MNRKFRRAYRGYADRKTNVKSVRKRFLIVCEGEKTEPNYFNCFEVPKCVIKVKGVGANTLSLVRETIELKKKDAYDQTWCVFDRDSFPAQNFNNAILLAKRNGIKVAYSNEAFELWYLLHFNYITTALSRDRYGKMLTSSLGRKYEKNSEDMYFQLKDKMENAIENAKKLFSTYKPSNPEKDNPSTTVFELIEELKENSRNK
jgi:hypothetical protein